MPSVDHARLMALLRARPLPRDLTIPSRRAAFAKLADLFPLPSDIAVTLGTLGGRPVAWLVPPECEPGRVVLHVHGGAYVVGAYETHRELAARIGRASRARVALLEYRLAPEWPFPAALDDVIAAVKELVEGGIAPARLALVGDSAGGGLVVAAVCGLRDQGLALPGCGVAISPWTDLAATGPSLAQFQARDPLLDADMLRGTALVYLNGADPRDPRASPLYADLRGLPPLLIQCGTCDVLHDDATRLAERARSAGVVVTLEIWEQMVHVWHLFAQQLSEGRAACERIGSFITQTLLCDAPGSRVMP